ncbi:MAG: AsmA family protein, partial [Alphaproteobacteria bacterium]|nr:AsmA family protein [Alphaproteobacteria bacterium]
MKKFLKIALIVLFIPVVLFTIAFGFLKFADLNNYKPDIEKMVRKYAKVDMKINGNIEIGVSLKPSLELNDVYISDIEDNSKIARIGNALVQMSILPLLNKEIVIEKVQTENTEIFYNDKNSVLINDLDANSDDYDSPVNIVFDTSVAGIDIFGNLQIDSLKELKASNYDKSNVKANIKAMGYDLQYDGLV